MSTIKELLDYGKEILENSGNEYAKYDRKVILEYVTDNNYMYMLMNGDEEVDEDKAREYKNLIEKRALHYPLQYLLGYAYFMDYTFFVDENVLVPRSDTEILVEIVNETIKKSDENKPIKILDLCCGSGCIGISIKLYNPETELTLSDISEKALNIAKCNLKKYNLTAKINQGDLWEGLDDSYDFIVCNPPYIKTAIIDTLMPEVKDFEPILALDGGENGIVYYEKIVEKSIEYLDFNGWLFLEIGYDQGTIVSDMMKSTGFRDVQVKKDYSGHNRVVCGHL